MKYKVGDIVKLRDDLEHHKFYGGTAYDKGMNIMRNEPVEINHIFGENYRVFDKFKERWLLTDEMIEGLWEECKSSEQVSKPEGKLKLIDILNKIANGELKEGTKMKLHTGLFKNENNKIIELVYDSNNLYTKEDRIIFDIMNLNILEDEVELIEPQEPTECEHEWEEYETYNSKTREIRHYKECVECGLQEEIKPTDNTTEKIEELDMNEFVQGNAIDYRIVFKLNEVIRHINKGAKK